MKNIAISLLLALALAGSLAACSKNPQKRFAEVCAKEADEVNRNSCLCTGQELAKNLDKERFERLVDEIESNQSESGSINFSAVIKSDVLDQETLTAFMSSAKRCGPAR